MKASNELMCAGNEMIIPHSRIAAVKESLTLIPSRAPLCPSCSGLIRANKNVQVQKIHQINASVSLHVLNLTRI